MRTIAVINQKGGCGKTTTAINLAGVFASQGLRTLLVDVDPQSHCAAGLAIPEQRIDLDIGDAMLDPGDFDPARLLWRVSRNLDLAPSRMKVAGLEASRGGLADRPNKERALASVLERLSAGYDACCIDCPPGIGLLTYNALVAADTVLIPVETSYFSLRGAAKQIDTIRSVGRRLGVQTPYWLLATIHDESSALARDLLTELKREFESRVCPVVIRFDAALKEASSFGQSVVDYAPESGGAADYTALATWWLNQPSRLKSTEPSSPEGDPPVVHVSPSAGRAMMESKGPSTSTAHAGSPLSDPEDQSSFHGSSFAGPALNGAGQHGAALNGSTYGAPSNGSSPQGLGSGGPTPGGGSPHGSSPHGSSPAGPSHRPGSNGRHPPTDPHRTSGNTPSGPSGPTDGLDHDLAPDALPAATPTAAVIAETERALSRTEDLVRRALLLSQRGSATESGRPAAVHLVPDEPEAPVVETPGPISRLLGIRQTARGTLFVQPLSAGRSVAIAGDFNDWDPSRHVMRPNKGLGVFELLVTVPPGTYNYRLVVDGVWKPDPFNPTTQPNPYGEANSVLRVRD